MNKNLDWVHHDSKTFNEEQFMENIERKYIEKHTSHIKGFTKDYVDKLLEEKNKEIDRLNNIIKETRRILGEYRHYSLPDEQQNAKNEAIVDEAYNQLHSNLKELKEGIK